MKEDISRILKMVEEGKLTSEKAVELIDALKGNEEATPITAAPRKEKMLRVRVESEDEKVNINIPLKLVKTMEGTLDKVCSRSSMEGVDLNGILRGIEEGVEGKIVDIETEDGEKVEIFID